MWSWNGVQYQWMNKVVYQIACFMVMYNPTTWRWSHARHHTDTIIVGRDPEIAVMRPPDLLRLILNVLGIVDAWLAMTDMLRNASGRISAAERTFVPPSEQHKVVLAARIWLVIYLSVFAAAVLLHSILPLMLVGLPRLYGAWHMECADYCNTAASPTMSPITGSIAGRCT